MHPRAGELVRLLDLAPHPEGGFFRETFRSASPVHAGDGRGERDALTTIDFLLVRGQVSRWHAVASDEVWHLQEGDGLELFIAPAAIDRVERVVLGAIAAERRPVHVVPARSWQAARPLGDFALVGCTVGPGFEFADFRCLANDAAGADDLRRVAPALAAIL